MKKTIAYALAVATIMGALAASVSLNTRPAAAKMDDGMHEFMKKAFNCMNLMLQAERGDPRDARYYNGQYLSCLSSN